MTSFKNIPSISWSVVRWLVGFYVISLLVVGSVFRLFLREALGKPQPDHEAMLNSLDQYLVFSFWLLVFVGLLFSYLFIRRFLLPLDILIGRAKSIRRGQYPLKNGEVIKESRGEWYQLDLALNKISKDLKRRKADVERERGELEAVITAANDAILAVDRDMSIRYYNGPMAMFFDQKEEGNWGRKLPEVIRNQNIIEAFQNAIKERRPQTVATSQDLAIDGSTHYFQISISPFMDEKKQKPRGAVAIFHDITEHKKVEKVRMDFVANASHELKTPLTSIQGYTSFLADALKDRDDLKEAFAVVQNNVNRLNHLISDLLELSKIESADEVANQVVDVELATEAVVGDLKTVIGEKQHLVICHYDIKQITTNPDLLHHVLVNLVENAVKYCPDEAEIRVHWGVKEGHPYLSVKDNGPGIESYHQGRLFERFYRVRDEANQNTKGTGLGLSIVRNCMTKLGGHVDVKSAPGLGSEFICYFTN